MEKLLEEKYGDKFVIQHREGLCGCAFVVEVFKRTHDDGIGHSEFTELYMTIEFISKEDLEISLGDEDASFVELDAEHTLQDHLAITQAAAEWGSKIYEECHAEHLQHQAVLTDCCTIKPRVFDFPDDSPDAIHLPLLVTSTPIGPKPDDPDRVWTDVSECTKSTAMESQIYTVTSTLTVQKTDEPVTLRFAHNGEPLSGCVPRTVVDGTVTLSAMVKADAGDVISLQVDGNIAFKEPRFCMLSEGSQYGGCFVQRVMPEAIMVSPGKNSPDFGDSPCLGNPVSYGLKAALGIEDDNDVLFEVNGAYVSE